MLSVYINPETIVVNGKALAHENKGSELLVELYRNHVGDYMKFFKMDALCRLGFVASELLLQQEGSPRFVPREDRAVILFNRCGSYQADCSYQATIQDPANFFPSPSAFVYTLPNIVTGEIALRNKYYGETSFMVLPDDEPEVIEREIRNAFLDPMTESVLGGWLDCSDEEHFEARLYLYEKNNVI